MATQQSSSFYQHTNYSPKQQVEKGQHQLDTARMREYSSGKKQHNDWMMKTQAQTTPVRQTEQCKKADTWNSRHRLKKPDCYRDVAKKVLSIPVFTNAENLVDVLLMQQCGQEPREEFVELDSQSTALENLFVLAGVLMDLSSFHQEQEETQIMEQLFSCKWVLEQS